MKLYPQDLRDRQHAAIIRRRSYGVYNGAAPSAYTNLYADLTVPRLGRLGCLWTRGTRLTEREAAIGVPAASASVGVAQWAGPGCTILPLILSVMVASNFHGQSAWEIVGCAVGVWGIVIGMSMTVFPSLAVRRLYEKPLSLGEIDTLWPGANDEIAHAYLGLMQDAVGCSVPPDAEAGLRDALRSLGRAADSLPSHVPPPQNTKALRQQAADVLARARLEKDTVASTSLERQAEALERQAAASDRSALVTYRAHVLRAEVLAQMEALQAGLADFRTNAAPDTALLSALSDNAQRVADEASHVAQARAELEEFVAAPLLQESTLKESAVLKNGREQTTGREHRPGTIPAKGFLAGRSHWPPPEPPGCTHARLESAD